MKLIPVKSVLSKWLLTAIVLLGFFTFSGLTIQTPYRFSKPPTTLVASYANGTSKSISYNTTLKGVNRNTLSTLISGACNLLALSFLHSSEAKNMAKQTSWLFIPNKQIKYLFFIRAFGSDSADDSYPFIG
ncbi:hypothetical protein [Mucilaginibacter sp.]|uniref:hypothetical protein n=1 Tax=Mucilaginibacter sp. TaxID=1882438 RepID=UPI002ED4294A